jgi:serine protease
VFARIGDVAIRVCRIADHSIESERRPVPGLHFPDATSSTNDWSTTIMRAPRQSLRLAVLDTQTVIGDPAPVGRPQGQTRPRPARRLAPSLNPLEGRCLLASTSVAASSPVAALLNLQLPSASPAALASLMPAISAAGASVGSSTVPGLYQVIAPASSLSALANELSASPGVEYVAPTLTVQADKVPNDLYYAFAQWGLNGTYGINAPTAWATATGSTGVIVAVVDSGINYTHPDLVNNVWLNQAEIPAKALPNLTDINSDGRITFLDLNNAVNQGPGKIVDTDGDGVITGADAIAPTASGGWSSGSTQDGSAYPDDLIGWNFVAGSNAPLDDNGHGTNVSGIIGAVGNNSTGIAGVDWNTQIMAVKALDSTGSGSDVAAAEAIHYAVDHGARVINASWGLTGPDPTIAAAIQYANSSGVIIVAAAGNNGSNDTTTMYSPASYSAQYPNVISVAATSNTGALASWSNYGVGTVQIAAPGVNIFSTLYGSYGYMSGTSMAAPFVTGTVALVEAAHPSWSMSQVVDAILDHTTADTALAGKVTKGGLLNAGAAVANTRGAYVTSVVPNGSATAASPLSAIQLTFNEEVNPATFTTQQITFTGPAGTINGATVSVVSGSNNHQFVISFPTQTAPGTYNLTAGPNIQDFYGNKMDQNRNGVNGQTGDAFTMTIVSASPKVVDTTGPHRSPATSAFGVLAWRAPTDPASAPAGAGPDPANEMGTLDFTTSVTTRPNARRQPGPSAW